MLFLRNKFFWAGVLPAILGSLYLYLFLKEWTESAQMPNILILFYILGICILLFGICLLLVNGFIKLGFWVCAQGFLFGIVVTALSFFLYTQSDPGGEKPCSTCWEAVYITGPSWSAGFPIPIIVVEYPQDVGIDDFLDPFTWMAYMLDTAFYFFVYSGIVFGYRALRKLKMHHN